jgi:cytochrome P450
VTRPPEVPGGWLTGAARALLRDPLGTYQQAQAHGDVVAMRVGPRRLGVTSTILYHPDQVQHVLAGAAASYAKQGPVYDELRLWFGDGLLSADSGPRWQTRRRILQPLFTARQVAGFDIAMRDETEVMLRRWDASTRAGEPVDLHHDITALTLRVVSRVLFGGEADRTEATVASTYPVLSRHVLRRLTSLVPLPPGVPFPANVRAGDAKRRLFAAARDVVRLRTDAATAGHGDDLVDRLLAARDPETGAALSEDDVVTEIVTFLLAGHETTATALTSALHLLGRHPQVQEELYEEAVQVLDGRPAAAADVPRLGVAARAFHEALRLYPPAWVIPRWTQAEDVVGGYRVGEGTMVVTAPWVTQRDPRWWQEPDRFLPERWMGDRQSTQHRYSWFPFGGGPRACIGRHFALQEAVLALTAIVQRYRIRPLDTNLPLGAGVTLRPAAGVPALLEPRSL